MNWPESLHVPVREILQKAGDSGEIHSVQPVGGGCINNGMRLETASGVYFLKWNSDPLPGMFPAEARGLELLSATKTVRVPAVLGFAEVSRQQPAFILLEWLEPAAGSRSPTADQHAALGNQLAALHYWNPLEVPAQYGLDHHNYLGSSPQKNSWSTDWVTFYISYRLLPQQQLAMKNGHMPPRRKQMLEKLYTRLPGLLDGVTRQPSLIHGDLWGGNVIAGPTGPALIDPSVSFSDREAEIAYTQLFGGFSSQFYAAYQESWPLYPGFSERRDLYNLYHLLNHLNLFGESYGGQVDSILRYYAG